MYKLCSAGMLFMQLSRCCYPELGRLLTNCSLLLFIDYMITIVVSNII